MHTLKEAELDRAAQQSDLPFLGHNQADLHQKQLLEGTWPSDTSAKHLTLCKGLQELQDPEDKVGAWERINQPALKKKGKKRAWPT